MYSTFYFLPTFSLNSPYVHSWSGKTPWRWSGGIHLNWSKAKVWWHWQFLEKGVAKLVDKQKPWIPGKHLAEKQWRCQYWCPCQDFQHCKVTHVSGGNYLTHPPKPSKNLFCPPETPWISFCPPALPEKPFCPSAPPKNLFTDLHSLNFFAFLHP